MKNFILGLFAEYLILILYNLKLYKILHHRKKSYVGEVDLIAVRGKQLVFIEVKARKNGISENIVSNFQQNRIRRSAELFLSKNSQFSDYDVRFDLAVISPYKMPLIIQNAW